MGDTRKPKWDRRTIAASTAYVLFMVGLAAYSFWSMRGLYQILPYQRLAVAPLGGVIVVELMPRRWRSDFWIDLLSRALVIGAVCWTMFLLIFGKP